MAVMIDLEYCGAVTFPTGLIVRVVVLFRRIIALDGDCLAYFYYYFYSLIVEA